MANENGTKEYDRSAQKRRAIIDAAWQIFSRHGYERTTVDAIQSVCGGSKSTIYSYFKSKEELFLEVSFAKAKDLSARAFLHFPTRDDLPGALFDFSVNYLHFYLASELIEIFRLAASEAKRMRFGRMLYEKCFKICWGKVAAYLEERLEPERMLPGGGWTAAMHLRGLLDGDILLQHSWGIMEELPPEAYQAMAATAVTAFLRIYAPEHVSGLKVAAFPENVVRGK